MYKETEFSNLSRFDSKGRRVSLFGRVINNNVEIVAIKCSKSDVYKKSTARELYAKYLRGEKVGIAQMAVIPIENDKPKFTFLDWCRANYKEKWYYEIELDRGKVISAKAKNRASGKYLIVETIE